MFRASAANADLEDAMVPRSNRRVPDEFDKETHKLRHLIENHSCKVKESKGIATRSCKTDHGFKAFIAIAATLIQTR